MKMEFELSWGMHMNFSVGLSETLHWSGKILVCYGATKSILDIDLTVRMHQTSLE